MLTKFFLSTIAALFLLSVTAFNPATISRWIERAIGWVPLREAPATDEAPSLRAAVAQINATDLERHLRVLTADSSRVTGYAGAANAARYIEGEFHRLGLQVSSEFFPLSVPLDRGGRLRWVGSDEAIPHLRIVAQPRALAVPAAERCLRPPHRLGARQLSRDGWETASGAALR